VFWSNTGYFDCLKPTIRFRWLFIYLNMDYFNSKTRRCSCCGKTNEEQQSWQQSSVLSSSMFQFHCSPNFGNLGIHIIPNFPVVSTTWDGVHVEFLTYGSSDSMRSFWSKSLKAVFIKCRTYSDCIITIVYALTNIVKNIIELDMLITKTLHWSNCAERLSFFVALSARWVRKIPVRSI